MASGSGAWAGKFGQLARYVSMSGYRKFCLAKVAPKKADNLLYMKGSGGWRIAYRWGTLPKITGNANSDLAGVLG
ncbi:hypothetical protein ACJJIC_10990 [Microbulbifer sp. ANSA002]|uniref:hypothetical protein n=1 Tax=unclassified Microbulbifer TaxID=2619833 RepID=UPI0040421966